MTDIDKFGSKAITMTQILVYRKTTRKYLWNFHNMLTGANRSSYIDNFLDRGLNATQLTDGINKALYGDKEYSWFIE